MARRSNSVAVIVSLLMLLLTIPVPAQAGTQLFKEVNEPVSGFPLISEATIYAGSPFRSDTAGNTDRYPKVNASFAQGRPNGPHTGFDLQSAAGEQQWAMYGSGTTRVKADWYDSIYGRHVIFQHTVSQNGKTYAFQTQYAHLSKIDPNLPSSNGGVSATTKVGETGGTGSSDTSYPAHAHLEFRAPTTSGPSDYRYAPSFFYGDKGLWGFQTTFMPQVVRDYNKQNYEIAFRIQPMAVACPSGYNLSEDAVDLRYRRQGETTFRGPIKMDVAADGVTFYKDMTTLLGWGDYWAEYYIEVKDPTWEMDITCTPLPKTYTTYRPYRYRDATLQAPEDRPLLKFVTVSISPDFADQSLNAIAGNRNYATWVDKGDPSLILPNTQTEFEQFDMAVRGRITGRDGNFWTMAGCNPADGCATTTGLQYLVDVRNPWAAELFEGRVVTVRGADGGHAKGQQIIIVESEQGIIPRDQDN